MNDESPPKRVTRARAAAKTETGVKTTRIATAASKAKVTRATSTATTKRKTRSEDTHEDEMAPEPEHIIEPEPHRTRGRPKKVNNPEPVVEVSAPAPTRAHRGRHVEPTAEEKAPAAAPAKSLRGRHIEPVVEEQAPAPKPHRGRPKKTVTEPAAPVFEPIRSLRGRTVKIDTRPEDSGVVEEPPKKTARARAATVTKATAPKKTVKFEEPDKENIVPVVTNAKGKAKETATGLRAKPVRKPAAPRATRGKAKTAAPKEKEIKSSPLSPKKATQVGQVAPAAKESVSEDELSIPEKTPLKPLMRSPVKPPGSIFGTAKKLDFSTSLTVQRATTSLTQNLKESVMASPARRPPHSPFKDAMKADPQRVPLGGSMLGSPFKFSMPAARTTSADSPFKASLMASPARRPASPMKVSEEGSPTRTKFSASNVQATPKVSTFKISRFTTPRTMPKSVSRPGQIMPSNATPEEEDGSPTPKDSDEDDLAIGSSLSFSGRLSSIMPREVDPTIIMADPIVEEDELVLPVSEPIALEVAAEIQTETVVEEQTVVVEDELVDELDSIMVEEQPETHAEIPESSPLSLHEETYEMRGNEDPFQDSDSEDELASNSPKYSPVPLMGFRSTSHSIESTPKTPKPFALFAKTPKTIANEERVARREQLGFTPLAKQLSDWMAATPSPAKYDTSDAETEPASPTPTIIGQHLHADIETAPEPSPMKTTFFDDEMSVRDEMAAAESSEEEAQPEVDILEENFGPVVLDEVDFALADEADELSLLEPDQIEALAPTEDMFQPEPKPEQEQDFEEVIEQELREMAEQVVQPEQEMEHAPSEASQDYGDENAMPIDPVLLALPTPSAPATPAAKFATPPPKRILAERVCHTVSKVPLKPAADETPMRPSPVKRSASISRLPAQRPTNTLSRNNTVISYSPRKNPSRNATPKRPTQSESEIDDQVTPKGDVEVWSTIGTPARTPRRDLNTALLKGAVVFVDVYTSEGADASALFTELLGQMGARCVKSWSWNGNMEEGGKIGITHVVFKDGGKRTMEKVKEAGGVVTCVGVGWVLDCERENKWLDEAPYSVDSAFVPRGGHRRRKSMEPKALANLNGTLIPSATPSRNNSPMKDYLNAPNTQFLSSSKKGRRSSVQWIRSPQPPTMEYDDEESLILSPVPKTPAPETIAAYYDGDEDMETPCGQTPFNLENEKLVQKTAPAGRRYVEYEQDDDEEGQTGGTFGRGGTFLTREKDESVMMRLMAARRKSLQWAPKVGSPLAKGYLG